MLADYCSSIPCQNGGVCHNTELFRYICVCTKDYRGRNCELKKRKQAFVHTYITLLSSTTAPVTNPSSKKCLSSSSDKLFETCYYFISFVSGPKSFLTITFFFLSCLFLFLYLYSLHLFLFLCFYLFFDLYYILFNCVFIYLFSFYFCCLPWYY